MKYLIQESRLNDLIMSYLDNQFKGMVKHVEGIGGGVYTWWGIDNHGMVDIGENEEGSINIGIDSNIWNGVQSFFGLSDSVTDDYLKMWVEENLGISADEISVF